MRFFATAAARLAAGAVCGGAGAHAWCYAREKQAPEGEGEGVTLDVGYAGVGKGVGMAWGLPRFALDWDTRHTEDLLGEEAEESDVRGFRSVILVRHGQYFMESGELTDLGVTQAAASAARVAELCDGPALAAKPTSLLVSTATRARQTSEPFVEALGLTPVYDAELQEVFPSMPNDRDASKVTHDIAAHHAQAESAFRRVFRRPASSRKNEVCVVVCHANVIRYWTLRAMQLPPDLWTSLSIPHASITHIRITPSGRVNLRCMGDAGFHPVANVTTANIPRPAPPAEAAPTPRAE